MQYGAALEVEGETNRTATWERLEKCQGLLRDGNPSKVPLIIRESAWYKLREKLELAVFQHQDWSKLQSVGQLIGHTASRFQASAVFFSIAFARSINTMLLAVD
jgi:hypothetical protein